MGERYPSRHQPPKSSFSMDSGYPFLSLVLASCGTSIVASLLRIHRVYLVYRQGSHPRHVTQRLNIRYHRGFLFTVIAQIILSLSTTISFGVLAIVKGDTWLVFASGSVVLWSMVGQVRVPQSTSLLITNKLVSLESWLLAYWTTIFLPGYSNVRPGCLLRCLHHGHYPGGKTIRLMLCVRRPFKTTRSWVSRVFSYHAGAFDMVHQRREAEQREGQQLGTQPSPIPAIVVESQAPSPRPQGPGWTHTQ